MQRWRTAAVTGALLLVAGRASTARAGDLPAPVRTEPAVGADNKALVEKYVADQIKRLNDPATAGAARDELTRQADATPTVTPSSSFLGIYTEAVAKNIPPLLDPAGDVNKRLNAAIVLAKLSHASPARSLLPLAQKSMKDPSSAVAMWGIKAGAAHLEQTMSIDLYRKGQTLTPSIVDAAKAHPEAGPLAQTAYDALYFAPQPKLANPDPYKLCAAAMNDLVVARTALYQTGIPASPQADQVASVYFVLADVRPVILADAKLRVTTVQNCLNLMKAVAGRMSALPPTDPQQRLLLDVFSRYASTLAVLFNGQPTVSAPFQRLASSKVPLPPTVAADITAAANGVAALPDFKAVKAP